MRTVRFLLVFLVIAVLAVPGTANTALAGAQDLPTGQPFPARLLGESETPPVETAAHGASLVTLNASETALAYVVVVHQIENVTAAHIHCGAPGVAGPVVVPLFPVDNYSAAPAGSGVFLVAGRAAEEDITPVPDSEACPGGIASFAELVAKMHAGETYVNVHTEQNPAGEVRGQNYPLR
jgi:hypothetical protein